MPSACSSAARKTARARRVIRTMGPGRCVADIAVQILAGLHDRHKSDMIIILVTISNSESASRRKWMALVVVCLGQLMMVVDMTIVNVALPVVQRDLRFSQADLTWVVNAYLISYGSFLLMAGRLGDLVGRKRVFLAGLTLFTL